MKLIKILSITIIVLVFYTLMIYAQTPVEIVLPEIEDIGISEYLSGRIVPEKIINLPAEINGVIDDIYVEVGDQVNIGDRILKFDSSQLLIQKKQAEAGLDAAVANHEQLLKGTSEEDIKIAEANYEQAQISLENAQKSLNLLEEIYNERTSLKQQLINAEMQYENTQKQFEAAEKRIEQAKTTVQQAEIGLKQANINLEQTKNDYNRMEKLYKEELISDKELEGVQLQLENAKISYDNAQIQLENAESSVESAVISKEQSGISLNGTQQIYKLAEENYNNPTQLKQQLQQAETQVDVSRVNLKIAEANLEKAKKGAKEEQIKASEANIKQAEASLDQVELQLSKTIIKSPIKAQIASINTEENEMIGAGNPVVRLAAVDKLNVQISVTPELRGFINQGDIVEILIKNGQDRNLKGKIKTISPIINPQEEAYPVVIELTDEIDNIYPGMFVDVKIGKRNTQKALTIPINAVNNIDDNSFVYVVQDNKAVKTEVVTGIVYSDKVEIIEGLSDDSKVIIQGQKQLVDGQAVEVVE